MSYTIHHTEGLILKSRPLGEADRFFLIFTKDFGLVRAYAQGVRLLKSKLRYNLSDWSLAHLALVRGKEGWRLTGVEKIVEIKKPERLFLFVRLNTLLLRLLHGEEKNPFLFSCLEQGIRFLDQTELSKNEMSAFECLMAMRILFALGYLGAEKDFEPLLLSTDFSRRNLIELESIKTRAVSEINRSLRATQL